MYRNVLWPGRFLHLFIDPFAGCSFGQARATSAVFCRGAAGVIGCRAQRSSHFDGLVRAPHILSNSAPSSLLLLLSTLLLGPLPHILLYQLLHSFSNFTAAHSTPHDTPLQATSFRTP